MKSKFDDLWGRSRRQNIRILSIPEGSKNGRPTESVVSLLSELCRGDSFAYPIIVDRAHRLLGPKPTEGNKAGMQAESMLGALITKQKKINWCFRDYSTALFSTKTQVSSVKINTFLDLSKLDNESKVQLNKDFSVEEVKQAIMSLPSGPDEFGNRIL